MEKEEVDKRITLSENRATIERDVEEQEKRVNEMRKNNGFTQLDDLGMSQLEKVFIKSSQAGRLFLKICQHMDNKGAVVASRDVLAQMAGVSTKNLGRLIKILVEYGIIRDMKLKGMPVIAINPQIAWRSWNTGKEYAVFHATVIMDQDEFETQDDFDIRRAKAVLAMAKKKKGKAKDIKQTEFPPPVGQPLENLEIIEE